MKVNINYYIKSLIISFIIVSLYNSCNKIKYYPDKDYKEVKTRILGHRGCGIGNPIYQPNTLEAAKYGLTFMDGIEVDVQLSKDRTVWIEHSADLPYCGGISYDCFPESTDNEIVALDSCNGNSLNYSRLEDVFAFMSSNYPDKYISLDVRPWNPCALTSINVSGIMDVIAGEIIRLTNKYNLQNHVMVESGTKSFLNYIMRHSNDIECYLSTFGDYEKAIQTSLEYGYAGLSFEYKNKDELTVEHIQLLRKKGLKIQLWTVNDEKYLKEALSINPDFIQTDYLSFFIQL